MRLTRRHLLRLMLATGACAAALPRDLWSAVAARATGGGVHLFDVSGLAADRSPAGLASAYDTLHLVAALQGIVNRAEPRLWLRFLASVDDAWLDVLRSPGNLLDGVAVTPVGSLDDLLGLFAPWIAGAVIWDPQVPATSNVASTVAGVEDLVPIRYDPGAGSLYTRHVAPGGASPIAPVRWLVNPDGSPMFTGRGSLPGTGRPSTGSAKCDAYAWAQHHYLDRGRCDPTELGYYVDSWFLRAASQALTQSCLPNHDYLVARRGFVLDLDVWDDEAPVDDPQQPPGTDVRTLQGILASTWLGSGGAISTIHGFIPWTVKYSNATAPGPLGGGHAPVASENRLVSTATQYNACLDADAPRLGAMVNASLLQHARLAARHPQAPIPTPAQLRARGLLDGRGRVVPAHYLGFYAGDFNSAAWLYEAMPALWGDGARGRVPVNWAIDPNLERRAGPLLAHLWTTRTENDVFVSGDSGAGYVNPGLLEEPRPLSGLPSGMAAWAERCERLFARWDVSVTGFVIDGEARPLSPEGRRAYARFSPTGVGMESLDGFLLVAGVPMLRMTALLPATVAGAAATIAGALRPDLDAAPPAPTFSWFRTVLQPPSFHAGLVDLLGRTYPAARITVVDAHTLFQLLRVHLAGSVALRAAPDPRVGAGGGLLRVQLVNCTGAPVQGELSLETPAGWQVSPARTPFELAVESSAWQTLEAIPAPAPGGAGATIAVLTAVVRWDGRARRHPFTVTLG
jgi:GxGYxYP putative glycoside hydrolase C-terminal domain/GxGYxYP_N second domain